MSVNTRTLILRTPRLSIQPFSAEDAIESFDCLTTSLTRYMSWEPPASREEYAQVWAQWIPAIADGSDVVFAIRQLEDARFLGLVGLHNVNDETPELGIWIREDEHRRGFGKEAVGAIVQWACEHLTPSGFVYPVAKDNRPSRLIAEALGGTVVGTRTAAKYDSVVYSIPPHEVAASQIELAASVATRSNAKAIG